MKDETLFENEWVSLKRIVAPKQGVRGYVYSHETRCSGIIIALLPYLLEGHNYQYLLRKELTPCWSMTKKMVSTITGGFEDDVMQDAVRELREEAGYTIEEDELIDLGTCFGTKSSDTLYHLFSVDLTLHRQGKVTGDGSQLEKEASVFWGFAADVLESPDPLASAMFLRLDPIRNSF